MSVLMNTYLHFADNTREAMEFYKTVFGGNLTTATFKEFQASRDPSDDDKIMHAELRCDNGIVLMASDTPKGMEDPRGINSSMSLSGDDEARLRGYFDKLAAGGMVTVPLSKQQWGDMFGMLTDKFGVPWMVNIAAQKA